MLKLRKWFGAGAKTNVTLPLDLTDPAFIADPTPTYAWLRENAPLCAVKSGGYLMTRHADIKAALSGKDLGNAPSRFAALHARNADKYPAAALVANIPPFLDMPEHKLPRQALSRSFHNTVATFADSVDTLAHRHVTAARGMGEIDLITTIAQPFACQTIAQFIGLSAETDQIKAATTSFFRLFAPAQDAVTFAQTNAALAKARDLMTGALTAHHAPSLISNLVAFQADQPDLTDQHIIDNALLVLADGVENIEAGITQAALSDATHLDAPTIRNILAAQSPAQIIPRVCREAFSVHGQDITVGTPVFLALGSANISGDTPIPFGAGRHSCIGESLAVMMVGACARALRDSDAHITATDLHYAPMFGHRWPRGVHVTLLA
jgi:cytochrome P450